jgi:cell division protein FtsL
MDPGTRHGDRHALTRGGPPPEECMSRLDVVLLVLLLGSCLYLVRTSYEARDLYTELDKQNALARDLHSEYEQLDVERRAESAPLRVEKIARERLHMANATPLVTQYVNGPLPAPLPSTSAAEEDVPTASQPGSASAPREQP